PPCRAATGRASPKKSTGRPAPARRRAPARATPGPRARPRRPAAGAIGGSSGPIALLARLRKDPRPLLARHLALQLEAVADHLLLVGARFGAQLLQHRLDVALLRVVLV